MYRIDLYRPSCQTKLTDMMDMDESAADLPVFPFKIESADLTCITVCLKAQLPVQRITFIPVKDNLLLAPSSYS